MAHPRTQTALTLTYGVIAVLLIVVITAVVIVAIKPAQAGGMTLTSPDVADGKTIGLDYVYNGFGCTGKNISPGLNWTGAPDGTQSFAVTVYDPDAPTGSGWWHWIVYNIPANSDGLPQGLGSGASPVPKHVRQGRSDYGQMNYGGPCPPVGAKPHRYVFTVYALPVDKLELPNNPSAALIGFQIKSQAIASGSFTAMWGR
jgi:Raf kinase inhibitor-like YbhB/YbcL family protein